MSATGSSHPLPPDPRQLVQEAAAEVNRRPLRDYAEALRTLREKGFSYRDIAAWLAERGVVADHNAVYRAISETPPRSGGASEFPSGPRKDAKPASGQASAPSPAVSPFEESTLLD